MLTVASPPLIILRTQFGNITLNPTLLEAQILYSSPVGKAESGRFNVTVPDSTPVLIEDQLYQSPCLYPFGP